MRFWFFLIFFLFICAVFAGCASQKVYEPGYLADQILVPRVGKVGLTHGRCAKFKGNDCVDFQIKEYDLNDVVVRAGLRELNFICVAGQKRYLICKDKPGLCHRTYKVKKGFWQDTKIAIDEYVDQSETERLVNASTICFNEDRYPYEALSDPY